MSGQTAKCRIQKYDPDVTTPPLQFIQLGTIDVDVPAADYLGEQFARNLCDGCRREGHAFKFYSNSSDDDYDYDVVVYGERLTF